MTSQSVIRCEEQTRKLKITTEILSSTLQKAEQGVLDQTTYYRFRGFIQIAVGWCREFLPPWAKELAREAAD
jgi:hypothetical protein